MSMHRDLYNIQFAEKNIAPALSTPVVATSAGGAWTYGASSANILVTTFRIKIVCLNLYPNNNNTHYNIRIVDTAGTPNVYATGYAKRGAAAGVNDAYQCTNSSIVPVGTTLKAQCADSNGGGTIDIIIGYLPVD